MHGWAFRDLMRDRPSLCLPDDHDVYQGNIWGAAGNPVADMKDHAKGGYRMHADFVNAVERTQKQPPPRSLRPHTSQAGHWCLLWGHALRSRQFCHIGRP